MFHLQVTVEFFSPKEGLAIVCRSTVKKDESTFLYLPESFIYVIVIFQLEDALPDSPPAHPAPLDPGPGPQISGKNTKQGL